MARKVIQIAIAEALGNDGESVSELMVLCDDGTIWERTTRINPRPGEAYYRWVRIDEVPQT